MHRSRRHGRLARITRFAGVSLLATAATQALLFLFVDGIGWPGGPANLTAVACVCGPSYLVNRRWVWNRRAAHSLSRELLPYWAMVAAAAALSTAFASIAYRIEPTGWAVSLADMSAFLLLWGIRFLVLDAYLFKFAHRAAPERSEPMELV